MSSLDGFFRVCVKVYGTEPPGGPEADAALFVPIFHAWIRDRALDLVLFDVADYAHVPDGPGIVLVTHEAHFALDRSDGRFGLLAQRRTPVDGDAQTAVATTLRHALQVAVKLEAEPTILGKVKFDVSRIRIEGNDRLRTPNTDAAYEALAPVVTEAVARVTGRSPVSVSRIENDPRDRLALEVVLGTVDDVAELVAA